MVIELSLHTRIYAAELFEIPVNLNCLKICSAKDKIQKVEESEEEGVWAGIETDTDTDTETQ
jgi:hypothetical protein